MQCLGILKLEFISGAAVSECHSSQVRNLHTTRHAQTLSAEEIGKKIALF